MRKKPSNVRSKIRQGWYNAPRSSPFRKLPHPPVKPPNSYNPISSMQKFISALVVFCLVSAPAVTEAADAVTVGKPVSWTTDDGVELKGLYKAPANQTRPVWVLLHG